MDGASDDGIGNGSGLARRGRRRPQSGRDWQEAAVRGAWYADPYGAAAERWWDGRRWTQEVRGEPSAGEAAPSGGRLGQPAPAAPFCPPSCPLPSTALHLRTTGASLALGIAYLIRASARIVPGDGHPVPGYDLVTDGGRIGSVSVGWGPGLATMVCADGAWCLRRRRRFGWDFIIESSGGERVGSYSGRRWLPGGTISVSGVARQVDLRRPVPRRWRLQRTDTRKRLVEIREAPTSGAPDLALTIRSLPPGTTRDKYLMLLTACAIVIAERTFVPPGVGGGGGC
jgi:hypothetical protein